MLKVGEIMTNSYFRETHGNWPERTICLNFPPHLHDNIEIVVIIKLIRANVFIIYFPPYLSFYGKFLFLIEFSVECI